MAKRMRSARRNRRRVRAYRSPAFLAVVTMLILGVGLVSGVASAKAFVWPPPPAVVGLVASVLAIMFFVIAACVWFVGSVFGDQRFAAASPSARVKLAGQALAPILAILGLLPKVTGGAGTSS